MKSNLRDAVLLAIFGSLREEHGGISAMMGAILGVTVVVSAVGYAEIQSHQEIGAQKATGLSAGQFQQVVAGENNLLNKNLLADQQIAINAAENGVSFNQCAESSCATQYNDGSDQNVPANPSNLALTYANSKSGGYTGFSYTQDNQPYQPPVFGGVMPVWKSTGGGTAFMQANAPVGFWVVFAEAPTGQANALASFFQWKQAAEGFTFSTMLGGLSNENLWIGDIANLTNVNTAAGEGFRTSMSGGSPYIVTMGGNLAFPITGGTEGGNLMLPSFYGLDPSVQNDWGTTSPLQVVSDKLGYQTNAKQTLAAFTGESVGVPDGYFYPAVTFPLTAVPAGLALKQWTVSTPAYCQYGGNLTNNTVYQIQTSGTGGSTSGQSTVGTEFTGGDSSDTFSFTNNNVSEQAMSGTTSNGGVTNGSGGTQQVQVNSYQTGSCNPPPPPPSNPLASGLATGYGNVITYNGGTATRCNQATGVCQTGQVILGNNGNYALIFQNTGPFGNGSSNETFVVNSGVVNNYNGSYASPGSAADAAAQGQVAQYNLNTNTAIGLSPGAASGSGIQTATNNGTQLTTTQVGSTTAAVGQVAQGSNNDVGVGTGTPGGL